MPAFIITGSRIIAATRSLFSASARATASGSLNGTTTTRSRMACGIPVFPGTPMGCSRGPTSSASGSTDTCTESW